MKNLNLCFTNCRKDSRVSQYDLSYITKINRSKQNGVYILYIIKRELFWFTQFNSRTGQINLTNIGDLSLENEEIISVEEIPNSILILLRRGDIIEVSCPLEEDASLGFYGATNMELTAVSCSPDCQRIIYLSRDEALIMSFYCEEISRICISSEEKGKIERASVGWGQKDTQFKGPGMKNVQILTDNKEIKPEDDASYITWQEDSLAFAINYYCPGTMIRKVKIFNNDGILQYITDDIYGLEGPIAWQPSRRFVATVQIVSVKEQKITFLEQNALRHSSFPLPISHKVKNLFWNSNSDILAVYCLDKTEIEKSVECILLYVVSNYKWFLKQRLVFKKIAAIKWDSKYAYRLHILLHCGIYRTYDWNLVYNVSYPCYCDKYIPFVASIDGNNVNLTSLNKAIIPPPMFETQILLNSQADSILFPQGHCQGDNSNAAINCNALAVVTENTCLTFFTFCNGNFQESGSYSLNSIQNEKSGKISIQTPLEISCWFWRSPYTFYFNWCKVDENGNTANYLCVAKFDVVQNGLFLVQMVKIEYQISAISALNKGVLVHFTDKSYKRFMDNEGDNINNKHFSIINCLIPCPELMTQMTVTKFGIIGLSENNNLYCKNNLFAPNVVSFYWSTPYLVISTDDYVLKIYKFFKMHGKRNVSNKVLMERKLEYGMRIVTILGSTLILQHPRGNIETIVPRPFVLSYLHWMLKHKLYYQAFHYLRKLRISYNMLFDHDSNLFLNNVNQFVEDSKNEPDIVSSFINELEEKNYAIEIYGEYYNDYNKNPLKNKISIICNALTNAMLMTGKEHFSLQILTCLVKCQKLKEALEFGSTHNLLSYLLKIVSGRDLFKSALCLYKLDLALTVARMAQLDPKEYQSTLNTLNVMEENYKRFNINKLTGNFKEALYWISQCNLDERFDECIMFIQEHKLYLYAIDLFKGDRRYNEIVNSYGTYLVIKKHYVEAATIFEVCQNYRESVTAYRLSGQWKSALFLAKKLNYTNEELKLLATNLSEDLIAAKKYSDVAKISYFYLKNTTLAVEYYSLANEFNRSIDVAVSHNRDDLVQSIVKPQITVASSHIWKSITKNVDLILKYSKRIKMIKEEKKIRNNMEQNDEEVDDNSVIFDMYERDPSIVGSCRSSGKITTSSKSSHKTEKRLWNLKEGNPREEIALYKGLHTSITELHNLKEEVNCMCSALFRLNECTQASYLQKQLKYALILAQEVSSIIWPCSHIKEGGYDDIRFRCPPILCNQKSWEMQFLNGSET